MIVELIVYIECVEKLLERADLPIILVELIGEILTSIYIVLQHSIDIPMSVLSV